MLLKISKWLLNISQWFRYKATYLEMKHYVKSIKHSIEVRWMKPVYPYMRNIGKSYSLVKLALKYDLPIAVPTQLYEKNIKHIAKRDFKNNNLKIVVINDFSRGKRFETLLVEEGFKPSVLYEIVYPMCKNIIGYVNY